MATINLPSWFDVLECEAALVPEVRGFAGPFGGPTETQDLLGDRWRMRLTLPDGDFNWGGRTEALFNRLRGGADWLRLHHFAKPVPRGTARGSLVLTSSLAQGGNILTIAGARDSGGNRVLCASFENDTDANGLSDLWQVYSSGTTGAVTYARSDLMPINGIRVQRCSASGLGSGAGDRVGIVQQGLPVVAGRSYTASAWLRMLSSPNLRGTIYVAYFDSVGTPLGSGLNTWTLTDTLVRCADTSVAPASAVTADLYIWAEALPGGPAAAAMDIDAVQFEEAATASAFVTSAATFRAGDMLGYNGEQLFQVYEDVAANSLGEASLTFVNRARKAIASGQAIVWDKPSLPFQLLDASGVPTAYARGRARGQQVEFVEAWLA